MSRILVTILLMAAWHFPTTFFAPSEAPREGGWFMWPFGKTTGPLVDGFAGVLAPTAPPATGGMSVAMVLAGIASIAFVVAIAGLWGIVIPAAWFGPAAIAGAAASGILFLLYLGPLAIVPLVLDAVILWGVLLQTWTPSSLASS